MALTSSDPRECVFTAGLDFNDRLDKHMVLLRGGPQSPRKAISKTAICYRSVLAIALFVKMGIPSEY
ncbi:hypothetical protein IVA98_28855 [Bradyrhizobium sp. 160]|uniref:hypothetical protein n=1 Tax=unclassified Bradyrhizobium TaxID=2631580 RepID=UPI001FFB9F2B|nr:MULTISPECIES: hypothetical protein [unclassified Bradyrhizobium]MCK1495394.1 hypothetical protein [Bradyrhizobium sp. 180]MCK1627067.1 hypothetical protein [Bradyrhizobium sp. 160]